MWQEFGLRLQGAWVTPGPSQERRARCHHVGAHYRTSCLEWQLDQLFFVTQQGGVLV